MSEMTKQKNRTDGIPRDVGDVVSIIGPGMKIVGDCSSDGTIRIEGQVEGSVKAAKSVVIGKDGAVVGDVVTQDAIVAGRVRPVAEYECVDWVCKDESRHRMLVVGPDRRGAKEAKLAYRLLRQVPAGSLLEIDLQTGRKHQIRLQLGHRGHPVLGDRKYGSQVDFPLGIALLARRLKLMHPVRREPLDLVASVPQLWSKYGVRED